MKEGLKPTRMELLNCKQRLALAEKGHKLLKQKRDALVLEFFAIIKQAEDLRTQLDVQVIKAYRSLAVAQAFHGDDFLETAAMSAHVVPEIEVTSKNIMGVKIPSIKGVSVERDLISRGYSIRGSSAKFDEAVSDFEQAVNYAIKLAETESALKRLLKEIEKTNRRVYALEFNIKPDLKHSIKAIQDHLNRLESELFFSLKITKRRLERAKEAELAT
ncbi:MAG: V-type ATP synthase subunit D [Candidatus Micrarchaeota archaeon]